LERGFSLKIFLRGTGFGNGDELPDRPAWQKKIYLSWSFKILKEIS